MTPRYTGTEHARFRGPNAVKPFTDKGLGPVLALPDGARGGLPLDHSRPSRTAAHSTRKNGPGNSRGIQIAGWCDAEDAGGTIASPPESLTGTALVPTDRLFPVTD